MVLGDITESIIDVATDGLTEVSSYAVSAQSSTAEAVTQQFTITTQSLNIEYYRYPKFTPLDLNGSSVSLSSIGDPIRIIGSALRLKITAHSDQKIVSGTFNGSSIFIPQTFDIFVDTQDIHGNIYAGVSGVSGIAGPKGRLITRNMGVYRRATQSGDTEWSESITNVMDFSDVSGSPNYTWWGFWDVDNTHIPRESHGPIYALNGLYNPANESIKHVARLLTELALDIKNHGFYDNKVPANLLTIPHYDHRFHSYT